MFIMPELVFDYIKYIAAEHRAEGAMVVFMAFKLISSPVNGPLCVCV